jgi:hypothetical protein
VAELCRGEMHEVPRAAGSLSRPTQPQLTLSA